MMRAGNPRAHVVDYVGGVAVAPTDPTEESDAGVITHLEDRYAEMQALIELFRGMPEDQQSEMLALYASRAQDLAQELGVDLADLPVQPPTAFMSDEEHLERWMTIIGYLETMRAQPSAATFGGQVVCRTGEYLSNGECVPGCPPGTRLDGYMCVPNEVRPRPEGSPIKAMLDSMDFFSCNGPAGGSCVDPEAEEQRRKDGEALLRSAADAEVAVKPFPWEIAGAVALAVAGAAYLMRRKR